MSERYLLAENVRLVRCRSHTRAAWYAVRDTIGDLLGVGRKRQAIRKGEFAALEGINFAISPGEVVGVIGNNGAGKSTLLKLLSGAIEPTSGTLSLQGRVDSVIEIGGELNPHLTGRENLSLGTLMRGFKGSDGEDYRERVTEFADLGDNLDEQTGSYSNGMRARLSFAMAAMARPDFLLVDEALSVGDLGFQRKCLHFIEDFVADGGGLLFVSHNQLQVQSLCDRAILMRDGRIALDGDVLDVVRAMVERDEEELLVGDESENGNLRIVRFGNSAGEAWTGQPAELVVSYSLEQDQDRVSWGFELWTSDKQVCVTSGQCLGERDLAAGKGELRCLIDDLPIAPGTYRLRVNLVDRMSGKPIAYIGYGGMDATIKVHCAPSILSNRQMENNEIAVVDIKWL